MNVFAGNTFWLYAADTQQGASGAPVIAYSDHQVVALHYFAFGCHIGNAGTAIEEIISDLGADLPMDAVNYSLEIELQGAGAGVVTSDVGGIDCPVECAGTFGRGRTVTLTADPSEGSRFEGWAGETCSGTGPCQVTMTQDFAVKAFFAPETALLSVSKQGAGAGVIVTDPAGIDCGGVCSAEFNLGSSVALEVIPAPGSVFVEWQGDSDCADGVVTLTDDVECVAICNLTQEPLTITKVGDGQGDVTSDPAGIDCGADCTASFDYGTAVQLQASGDFFRWIGDPDCFDGLVTVESPISCVAEFVAPENLIFADGFENDDCTSWSEIVGMASC